MNPTIEERRSLWFLLPIVLLSGLLTMLAVLIGIATHDDGFAVEQDYYEKASSWDALMEARARSERLGWSALATLSSGGEDTLLSVTLVDPEGTPIHGAFVQVDAFHNARAADVEHATLTEVANGRYEATLGSARPGLWEVRLLAIGASGERYLETMRLDLVEGRP